MGASGIQEFRDKGRVWGFCGLTACRLGALWVVIIRFRV